MYTDVSLKLQKLFFFGSHHNTKLHTEVVCVRRKDRDTKNHSNKERKIKKKNRV